MNIILFGHPDFLNQQSMPRFLQMLHRGLTMRGHQVSILKPKPLFVKLPFPQSQKKWLGYIDQFVVFPLHIKNLLRSSPSDTLFVFTDHALGPWMPIVAKKPMVVHCHDFLAQRSALGEFKINATGLSGKLYQKYIRRGYRHGQNFISVSKKTKTDLHRFLNRVPRLSTVVYNGFNQVCRPTPAGEARKMLKEELGLQLGSGYFLHVGGNDWYKNKAGVIEMYNEWRQSYNQKQPLLLIGNKPSSQIVAHRASSPYSSDIYFLSGLPDEVVQHAYSGATALLFPSLAEGFGWPIAEAMACGCPVITTNEPPMNEVAGEAAFLIPARPSLHHDVAAWCSQAAKAMQQVATLSQEERQQVIENGIANAHRFDTDKALDQIEKIYQSIIDNQKHSS